MLKKSVVKVMVFFLVTLLVSVTAYADDGGAILEEVKQIIQDYYIGKVSDEVLRAQSVEEMLQALGDPYSSYMAAQQYLELLESINMELVGIGVSVEKVADGVLIISVFDGSGAQEAGLMPGDIILNVDGVGLAGLDLDQAMKYIKGEEGTSVQLTIKRRDDVFSVTVFRKKITLSTVDWEVIHDVGYIRVWSFGDNTDELFADVLSEMMDKNIKGLIVDLRGNGGGYLDTAVAMVSIFVGPKTAVIVTDSSGTKYHLYNMQLSRINLPTLILTDKYTASASEIFAGALRDYGVASLLGDTTFGKGSVQSLFTLSNGDVLKLTTGYFYTPRGNQINGVGLKPDLHLPEEFLINAGILLLSGDAESRGHKGDWVSVEFGSNIYDIDLNMARQDEFWESYKQLIESALDQGAKLYVMAGNGRKESDERQIHRWYYPYYDEVPVLEGIKPDKEFTLTFSKPVDADEVKDKIQLIDSETGQRISCSVYQVSDTQVKVVPEENLQNGREYYLIMQEGIRARNGASLRQGVLCRAVVEE